MKPSIARMVHYVSYGTPFGEYQSECRAATVTAVDGDKVSLFVMTPNGSFHNEVATQDEDEHRGGTWHWPERVE